MAARSDPTADGKWIVCCVECDLLPSDDTATDYETAEREAAAHNVQAHARLDGPEWAEVMRWSNEHVPASSGG